MGAMNELIDADAVAGLRARLASAAPGLEFPALADVAAGFGDASLRQRTDRVSAALLTDLPADYSEVATVYRRALADPAFAGWTIWPVGETVTTLGLKQPQHFADALGLLAELTPRLTSEFPIRRLLDHDIDAALAIVLSWTTHPDPHVRRLASEGTRVYLPWAVRVRALHGRPEATVPILDALYRDESDYVRRSVANHLNDLARQNPDLVVEVAARWLDAPDENTAWVVRHGLRTLVKKAHPGALGLLGFAPVAVSVSDPVLDATVVTLPGNLGFRFILTNDGPTTERMAVDYVVHFMKSNGRPAEKVFKLTAVTLAPGESVTIAKRHALRQMTTRVHYAGTHTLELQINGERHTRTDFEVVL
ncbi:DNA alkylation repair protein [Conyzicola sp.]|uniref:DNA alkylation repair protein n=1 Tax=Conyzicola sp. TaxID=1969404 RepID=UPI003988E1A4